MSTTQRLRILIVAPNASSAFGGEAFLPLKYFQLLLKRGYPVRLIAHRRNRDNLESELGECIQSVEFIEDTIWHKIVWTIGKFAPGPIREGVFGPLLNLVNERYIAQRIWKLVRTDQVDVIHQPIPVSPKTPSTLYGFGRPVVIGPMNGGMTYPEGYEYLQSSTARHFVAIARFGALMLNKLIAGKRKAAILLVANERTRAALPVRNHPNVITLVENGVDMAVWRDGRSSLDCPPRQRGEPFRLVFIGRLVAWKAVDITIAAIKTARARGIDVRLDLLGDGEERKQLEALALDNGLEEFVTFRGFRPQAECAHFLSQAHGLILNSVHECGGAVVLEAMALGLPVIVSDWGGPADYVDPTCGILESPAPRNTFSERISDAIVKLAEDPIQAAALGVAGRKKVEAQFDWENKIDRILNIYSAAIDGSTN